MRKVFELVPPCPIIDAQPVKIEPNMGLMFNTGMTTEWSERIRRAAENIGRAYNDAVEKYVQLALMFYKPEQISLTSWEDRHESLVGDQLGVYGYKTIKVKDSACQEFDWATVRIDKRGNIYWVVGALSEHAKQRATEL